MPIDTSNTALGSAANANADAGGSYAAGATGDSAAGAAIASDYANGKATVDTTYSSTNGNLQNMTSSCSAILAGFCVVADPKASLGQKSEALLTIEAGVGGLAVFSYAAAGAAASIGLVDAATSAAIATTVPIVGWIAAAAIALYAVMLTVLEAVLPHASGAPVPWSDADQANLVIEKMIGQMPSEPLPGAPFSDASRHLASLAASYVQAQLAGQASAGGEDKTMAMLSAPTSGFGYQADGAGDIHLQIAAMLGGDSAQADAFLSIVSVLWDPRWRGTDGKRDVVLGEAMELDPSNPQNILGGTMNLATQQKISVTDETGLPAASYLCEIAAAGFLAQLQNVPGRVYAAVYLRLCQFSWFYKACQDADGKNPIPVPAPLLATIGFMLDAATQNGASTQNQLLTTNNAVLKTAVKPTANLGLTAASRDLNYWVHYYLALGVTP